MTARDDTAAIVRCHGPQVWRRICRHLDGIAVGTTVAALAEAGVLAALKRAAAPLDIDALAAAHRSPRGCFHLAMRLLEEQGWVARDGIAEGGRKSVHLTAAGREWLACADSYRAAPPVLALAHALFAALTKGTGFDAARLSGIAQSMPRGADDVAQRVRDHLWGALAGAALSGLKRARRAGGEAPAAAAAFDVLEHQGWAHCTGELSDTGRLAFQWAEQYDHSISYFPTFAGVPGRLFPTTADEQAPGGYDRHLDRRLDIDFSGAVFSRTCRDDFFAIALPLFDRRPLEAQPAAVIDTGAGDGSLLRELYCAIRDRTERGRALAAYPLMLVGVEPSPIGREVVSRVLAGIAAPAVVIDGDIGDPAGIAARLAPFGVDCAAALHVSKSVIHDRACRPLQPQPRPRRGAPWPPSDAVFVAEDDGLIPHAALEDDLVGHFRKWLPWIGRHGMIAIEAHTAPAALIAVREGGNVMTGLDASHGYSHQYLVERPTYLRAAADAGLETRASRALGAEMLGIPILTIDHWWPAAGPPGQSA